MDEAQSQTPLAAPVERPDWTNPRAAPSFDRCPKTLTTNKLGREIAEMCGFAGIWDRQRKNGPAAITTVAEAMTNPLCHHGPDAGAIFADDKALFALGHPSHDCYQSRSRRA